MKKATLIHHFLEHSTKCFPDKVALVHEDVRANYRQINSQANQLARYLLSLGVKPGDRVVLLLENSLEYVVAYYGVLKAGAVAVPMNTELKADSLLPLLQELDAECLLTSRKFERLLRMVDLSSTALQHLLIKNPKLTISVDLKTEDWDSIVNDSPSNNLDLAIQPVNLGSIIYTSGSTGRPKGVMLSHGNIVANATSICQYLQLTDQDIQMVVLPFFYVMGKSLLNTHFAVGGRVVINNKFAYSAAVISQMIEEQVTGFSGVPSTYAHLLHQSPLAASRGELTSLRYCSQAGGHMSKTIKRKLLEVLPQQTKLYIMYGATEASARLTYVEPSLLDKKIDSIGKEIPRVMLKILDSTGHKVPDGDIGEIVALGDNIMQGYWRSPEATSAVLDQHGYYTGDLGYKDKDGYFFIVGRKDNQLKVGGHRVNPQEVEDGVMATGLVADVAVMGIPDPMLGSAIVAVVVAAVPDLDTKVLLSFCAKKLPGFKVPHKVVIVKSLPKSASGKIDRKKCLALCKLHMEA